MGVGDLNPRGKAVFIVTTVTFILASIFVAARLVSRFAILRHRTWDDWFIILAWLIAFGLSFAIDYGATKGLGRKDVDIPSAWLPALHKSEYAFTVLYNPALMVTKTSILIFYLRLSKNTQNILRIASYATLTLVNVDGVVLTFLNAFQCRPVSAAYLVDVPAKCLSIVTLYLCSAPVNIVANLAILVLPIPVLTGMHLPQRQKTVLVLTFSLGIFVTIVDVVRIYYLQQASDDQKGLTEGVRLGTGVDFSWTASTALMWSAVEVNIGIICACIPTLKPLIKRILPSMITDRPRNNSMIQIGSLDTRRRNSSPPSHKTDSDGPAIQSLPPAQLDDGKDEGIGMMDFLTTPGMDASGFETSLDRVRRTQTHGTSKTSKTTYFGFVNMRRPKSMLTTRGWECFQYCTAVTVLFFLWGFSYGLLNILNGQISAVAHESKNQQLALSCAYFGGYLFAPLTVGQWALRRGGFKHTFISGLCIYGTGTLMFWPSAVLRSFPGFLICSFVVGYGLAVLETAANPFIALCGPSQYAECRLLLAQGVQAVGTVLSQLLAQKVLFSNVVLQFSLVDVQWTYLGVALFTVILALFFYYMPLPEATDDDLQQLSENLSIFPTQTVTPLQLPLLWTSLAFAVFAQFCYVAAQESLSVWFTDLLGTISSPSTFTLTGDNYVLIGHTAFALGRFLFAFLCLIIPPRILLLANFGLGTIFAILTMSLKLNANGIAGIVMVFFFFEGPIFPLIFAIGLRCQGRRTKWAASLLTAGTSGGAFFPFVMYAVQQVNKKSAQYSFCAIIALMAFGTLFPAYLSLFPESRHQVDPAKATRFGNHMEDDNEEHSDGSPRRAGLRVSTVFDKMTSSKNNRSSDIPSTEHREQSH